MRLAFLAASLVLVLGCNETFEHTYANVAELDATGKRSYIAIPTVLPKDATHIHFMVDQDIGLAFGDLVTAHPAEMTPGCRAIASESSLPEYAERWIHESYGAHPKELRFYYCSQDEFGIAISPNVPKVLFWRKPNA